MASLDNISDERELEICGQAMESARWLGVQSEEAIPGDPDHLSCDFRRETENKQAEIPGLMRVHAFRTLCFCENYAGHVTRIHYKGELVFESVDADFLPRSKFYRSGDWEGILKSMANLARDVQYSN